MLGPFNFVVTTTMGLVQVFVRQRPHGNTYSAV